MNRNTLMHNVKIGVGGSCYLKHRSPVLPQAQERSLSMSAKVQRRGGAEGSSAGNAPTESHLRTSEWRCSEDLYTFI